MLVRANLHYTIILIYYSYMSSRTLQIFPEVFNGVLLMYAVLPIWSDFFNYAPESDFFRKLVQFCFGLCKNKHEPCRVQKVVVQMLVYFILFYFLFCFILFYFILLYFILSYFVLFSISFYFVLFCFILIYFILYFFLPYILF